MKITFKLNNSEFFVDVPATTRLSSLLRDEANIKSLKNGCNRGQCGCCSVLMNKRIVPSCLIPAFTVKNSEIMTLEGFKQLKEYSLINNIVKKANIEICDYCKGARYLLIYAFCESKKNSQVVSDEMILENFSGIRCNCIDMWTFVELVRSYLSITKVKKNGYKR